MREIALGLCVWVDIVGKSEADDCHGGAWSLTSYVAAVALYDLQRVCVGREMAFSGWLEQRRTTHACLGLCAVWRCFGELE